MNENELLESDQQPLLLNIGEKYIRDGFDLEWVVRQSKHGYITIDSQDAPDDFRMVRPHQYWK